MRGRNTIGFGVAIACSIAACGPDGPLSNTSAIDCVAVLGMPTPAGKTPLSAVPYSGAPRDKRIAELTDDELGRFSDFAACLQNGYRHDCCSNKRCPNEAPGDPPVGPFVLETVPLLADAVLTCYRTPFGESPDPSRELDIQFYRNTFGRCHMSLFEDCVRERTAAPLGILEGPDCGELNNLCASP